ncbi:hypothetical protein [Spiroplasma ixodetis]|nr:hypothetical protein [Spiroplasma ixodetis]
MNSFNFIVSSTSTCGEKSDKYLKIISLIYFYLKTIITSNWKKQLVFY